VTYSTVVQIPGLVTGTWEIDPVHSEVSFVVRHSYNSPIPGANNALGLSDKVTLNLEVEAVLQGGGPAA
jgi:hypothetical protein